MITIGEQKILSEQFDSLSVWDSFCTLLSSSVTLSRLIGARRPFWCFAVHSWWNSELWLKDFCAWKIFLETSSGNCDAIHWLILHVELCGLSLLIYTLLPSVAQLHVQDCWRGPFLYCFCGPRLPLLIVQFRLCVWHLLLFCRWFCLVQFKMFSSFFLL